MAPSKNVLAYETIQEACEDGWEPKWHCDRLRMKIKEFLATKVMTQKDFLKACNGVNAGSYGNFMRQKGPRGGNGNGMYWGGNWFLEREEAKAKAAKVTSSSSSTTKPSMPVKWTKEQLDDILAIELPDAADENGKVPVFDNCDEVRSKTLRFLAIKVVTKSALLQGIGINAGSLRAFLQMSGKGAGGANGSYLALYSFLEKHRIQQSLPKSKARLKNEIEQGPDGFPLRHDNGKRWVYSPM